MTRPAVLVAAGAAVLVAAAGQAAHLVRAPHRPAASSAVPPAATVAAADAAQAAVRFSQHLLACPRRPAVGSRRPCGRVADLQTATQPGDGSTFTVLLTATLLPDEQQRGHVPVPLTLRLLVTSSKHGWSVTGAAA